MKRRLASGAAVTHESASFGTILRYPIYIRTIGEQDFDDVVIEWTVGAAKRCMQRRLTGISQGAVCVCPVFEQVPAKLPVPMEGGGVESEVAAQRVQRGAVRYQMADGADITMICAPDYYRPAMIILNISRSTFGEHVEHEIGATMNDLFQYVFHTRQAVSNLNNRYQFILVNRPHLH